MKQLALGRPSWRAWQEGGTESRDASPITAGPLWTAHQATVGKTSFFTLWGTLDFFSSSSFIKSANSFLWCAYGWFFKASVEPWQTWDDDCLLTSDYLCVTFGWAVITQKTLCNGAIKIVSPNFGCLFLRNNTVLLDGRHGCPLKKYLCTDHISIISQH